jgi:hypothetical protein
MYRAFPDAFDGGPLQSSVDELNISGNVWRDAGAALAQLATAPTA